MQKKRKKRSLRPGPILWLLLIVNVTLGLCFSKITSPVHVRADGIADFDHQRIEKILGKISGTPCLLVNGRSVEAQVLALPAVDKAELTRNIFGKALLSVRYRTPVAKLSGDRSIALSMDGVLYESSELPADLPTLVLPHGGPPTLISFASNWQPISIAALAVYSSHTYLKTDVRIEVDSRGVVCLNIGSGRVILGSCDDLDLKLKTLEEWLLKNPQGLNNVQELNLTLPTAPAVVPRRVKGKP